MPHEFANCSKATSALTNSALELSSCSNTKDRSLKWSMKNGSHFISLVCQWSCELSSQSCCWGFKKIYQHTLYWLCSFFEFIVAVFVPPRLSCWLAICTFRTKGKSVVINRLGILPVLPLIWFLEMTNHWVLDAIAIIPFVGCHLFGRTLVHLSHVCWL